MCAATVPAVIFGGVRPARATYGPVCCAVAEKERASPRASVSRKVVVRIRQGYTIHAHESRDRYRATDHAPAAARGFRGGRADVGDARSHALHRRKAALGRRRLGEVPQDRRALGADGLRLLDTAREELWTLRG